MNIEQAFTDQLLRHKHIIYKVCLLYAEDKEDVADLYQESVYNLWRSYANFEARSSFGTWVYRISLNTCITHLKKRKRYNFVPLEQNTDFFDHPEKDDLVTELYQLIRKLNEEERMYIMLWLEKKPYDEIAEIVGTNRNHVATRIHRIKEKLKEMSNHIKS